MIPTRSERWKRWGKAAGLLSAGIIAAGLGCATALAADDAVGGGAATQAAGDAGKPAVQAPTGQNAAGEKPKDSGLTAKEAVQNFNKQVQDPPDVDLGDDPLGTLADKLTDIHGDLSQLKTDKDVQGKQKEVVAALDQLIKKLEPKGGGSNNGNTPGTGRKKSMIVTGDPAYGDLHGVDPRGRQWATLPPKERDQILQSKTEGFPAGYEALLQNYYQRLAQEKSGADDKPADMPATAPAAP